MIKDKKYFHNCKDLEEAKKLYKDLVQKFHPDKAKTDSERETFSLKFQEIDKEFKEFIIYQEWLVKSSTEIEAEIEKPKKKIPIQQKNLDQLKRAALSTVKSATEIGFNLLIDNFFQVKDK